jgi:O-antigen ligase
MQNLSLFFSEGGTSLFGYAPVFSQLLLESISVLIILSNFNKIFLNKLNRIIFLWLIYSVFITILNSDNLHVDIRECIWWPLIYFLFYTIALNDKNENHINILIKKVVPILFIIFFVQYLLIIRTKNIAIHYVDSQSFLSSNQVFFVTLLFPFAFLQKKQKYKYAFLFLGLIAAILSFKRSALIYTSLIILVAVYFDFFKLKKKRFVKNFLIGCIFISLSFLAYDYINKLTDESISLRFEKISEDRGSGRLDIYEAVWNKYRNQSWEYKVLGIGFNGVRNKQWVSLGSGEYYSAHNDFLEILCDFGIIGIVIYLIFVIMIIRRIQYLRLLDNKYYQANIAAFIIFFVMSMVSHLVIYPTYFAYLVIIWAITEGQLNRLGLFPKM